MQLLGAVAGVIGLVLAFVAGFVAIAVVVGLALMLFIGLRARLAWLRWRKPKSKTGGGGPPPKETVQGVVIESEYTVISSERDES